MSREMDVRDFTEDRSTRGRVSTLEAAAVEVSDRLPGDHRVRVQAVDPTTGNPAVVASESAPRGGDVIRRAIDHLTVIGPVLGLGPVQAPEFVADGQVQETASGAQTVHAQQRYKGIPIFQSAMAVRFAPAGQLSEAVGSTITVDEDLPVAAALTVADAVQIAARHVAEPDGDEGGVDSFGEPYIPGRVDLDGYEPTVRAAVSGSPQRSTVLVGGPFEGDIPASLVWFPLVTGPVLAWMTTLTMPGGGEQYKTIVDANSGEVLYCRQTVQSIVARGNVYQRNGGSTRTMTDFPRPREAYPVDAEVPAGFPAEWVTDVETVGNAVFAHLGVAGPKMKGKVEDGVLLFDPAEDDGDDQKVLNIFYLNCYMHDYFYLLGFQEKDGNFQKDNLGRGGFGGDPVDARAHSGAVTGTANMGTRPDGIAPVMNMGLVTSTGRHTAFDSDVVFHEFMHGVTNRLVGGPMNTDALESPQSGGMGEGWGDYVACTINEVTAVGSWVVDRPNGIRKFPYTSDFPDGFGDLGTGRYDEVHNIGEIWCATLLEVNRNVGDRFAMQLVVDALKLSPANPGFLDMRDAILKALEDAHDAGEISSDERGRACDGIWRAFAKFGMGVGARSNGAQLSGIVADTSVPPSGRA